MPSSGFTRTTVGDGVGVLVGIKIGVGWLPGVFVGAAGVFVGGAGVAVGVSPPVSGVAVGGTGVFVGGTGVFVGGTGVAVGVSTDVSGVAVGGTGVFVGGTGVAVGVSTEVSGVAVGGTGVFVGGTGVAVGVSTGVSVGVSLTCAETGSANHPIAHTATTIKTQRWKEMRYIKTCLQNRLENNPLYVTTFQGIRLALFAKM